MANTIIKLPYLSGDLTYTIDVVDPSNLSVLQADISLTQSGEVHQGTVTGPHSGKLIFVVRHNGNFVESRIRTIADDASTYTILTGLDVTTITGSSSGASLPANPSDSDLLSTGYAIVYNERGERENNISISVQLVSGPATEGFSLDTAPRTVVSSTATINGKQVKGYVEFPGMRRGATYNVWRGASSSVAASAASPFAAAATGSTSSQVVPDAASFALAETLGSE